MNNSEIPHDVMKVVRGETYICATYNLNGSRRSSRRFRFPEGRIPTWIQNFEADPHPFELVIDAKHLKVAHTDDSTEVTVYWLGYGQSSRSGGDTAIVAFHTKTGCVALCVAPVSSLVEMLPKREKEAETVREFIADPGAPETLVARLQKLLNVSPPVAVTA